MELGQKLAELGASETVDEFEDTIGALATISPTEKAIQLSCGLRLAFECGHVSIPKTVTGEVDWGQVTKIKITALEARNA
jgi:hypothetical protein